VKLQVLDQYHGVYGPYEFGYNFDLQEEFVCRNALTRLGAYDAADDEMYLLALAEDGNAIAQLEMADMCSPSHALSSHSPPHHVTHCRAVTVRGA
jgi:hypothetical protein